MTSKVEIDFVKWGRFCELWHKWNTRKSMHGDAMLQIEKIFREEFKAYRKQLKLIRESVSWEDIAKKEREK